MNMLSLKWLGGGWRVRWVGVLSFCVILLAVGVRADDLADAEEGQKLAEQLRRTPPAQELDMTGKLNIRDANGALREVPFRFKGTITPTNWLTIYRAQSLNDAVGSTQTVAVLHSPGSPNTYWRLPKGAGEDWEVLQGADTRQVFAGSDFTLLDLGLEFLHWPQQKVLKKEMRKSRACTVLESKSGVVDATGYQRVVSWVDNVSGGILVAEAYDAQGRMIKEFTVNSLKKIDGNWQVQQMEMRTLKDKTRTRLDFEFKDKERSAP
jgi:Outer membrane lipoprotein-sorting protein